MNFLCQLTGVFSQPADGNPSVEMVEAAYRHHNLPWRYINVEVSPGQLHDAVKGARAMNWAGFNCSKPHKVAVMNLLDEIAESAAVIEAVNCVVNRGGKLVGENTDGKGFLASLREKIDPTGRTIVMFGAGGAARAIAVEAALAGAAKITIVNRNRDRAESLVRIVNDKTEAISEYCEWTDSFSIPSDTDIVVNATSVGLYPDTKSRLNIDFESLEPNHIVADVIPNPLRTDLIQAAELKGCTVLDGLGMLVNQGVIGIKYWTGIDANAKVMRERVIDVLGM